MNPFKSLCSPSCKELPILFCKKVAEVKIFLSYQTLVLKSTCRSKFHFTAGSFRIIVLCSIQLKLGCLEGVFKIHNLDMVLLESNVTMHVKLCLSGTRTQLKISDVTKTRNGLESGLANGLSQFLWNASFVTVLLF